MLVRLLAAAAVFSCAITGTAVAAEPVTLTFAHFVPDKSPYGRIFSALAADIERRSNGSLKVEVQPGGSYEKIPGKYLGHLESGAIDIAMLVAAYTPKAFPDYSLFHLPLQFGSVREVILTHQRMAERGQLTGYDRVRVLAAFATDAYELHLKEPFDGVASLRGRRIRAADGLHQTMLSALGAEALPGSNVTTVATSLASGEADGSLLAFSPARVFKVIPEVSEHVILGAGYAPLLVAMSRSRYDSLSATQRAAIDDASGPALLERLIATTINGGNAGRKAASELGHRIVELDPVARREFETAVQPVVDDWVKSHPRGRQLLDDARATVQELTSK